MILSQNYLYIAGDKRTARKLKVESYLVMILFLLLNAIGILLLINPYNIIYFITGLILIVLSSINIPIPAIIGYRLKGGCSIPFRKKIWSNSTKRCCQAIYYINYQINIKLLGGVSL
jgi:hypothetical protein